MNKTYTTLLLKGLLLHLILLFIIPFLSSARVSTIDFLDGVFRSQMKEHHIAGITLSLYSTDTLEITQNWGYSHVEVARKTDENTGFMIGSVSKLFVWVSVMQLIEQGEIDIDKPVNEYLIDFRLPESYSPVTMRHIMTHTAGFEDHLHLFSKNYEMLPEMETYLQENLPLQIYEPGTTPAYSNYAATLAAYVIEQITGLSFNDYVEQNVFLPLEMHNTTFRQPASFNISEAKSKGYVYREGRFVSPFEEYIVPAPAGAAVSTASDMLKFMKVLLNCGQDETKGTKILKNETIAQMLSLLETPHPQADGMAYGFMRMKYHGKDIVWHGGDTFLFHTAFVLVPEMQTGLFISINTGETGFDYTKQFLLILDYLNGNMKGLSGNKRVNGMNHFSGNYKSSRRIESNYLKILSSIVTLKVTAESEGLLLHMPGNEPELYRPYDEDIFVSDFKKLIFQRTENGKIDRLILSHIPIMVFEKISLRENGVFNLILLISVLLIGLKNIATPLWRFIRGDKRSREMYRWLLLFSGAAIWLFVVLFATTFSNVENIIFERPQGMRLILVLPVISLVLFVFSMFFWFSRGIWSRQPLPSTFWQFAGFLVMVLFYLQMYFWNFFKFWA